MLNQDELRTILKEWSFWETKPKAATKRTLELPKLLHPDLVLVIQGVRRSGKSTLLTQLPAHYGLDLAQCYFCNFEDPRLINALDYQLLSSIVALARSDHGPDTPCYFFFDEIQEVRFWEKFIHQHLERSTNTYFIVTGSNSSLLSGELGSTLTGRHITIELFPFNFQEFKTLFPLKTLQDYLKMGGFPKAITYENPTQLLHEYVHDILNRDVMTRIKARNSKALMQVAKMAFETCGSELSYRKIASVTDLTVDTVKSYLEAFEQAYLIFHCPFFSYSERQQVQRNKKFYPIDPALRTSITQTAHHDSGKALESLVFLRLREKYKHVYYYADPHHGEVDFVVQEGSTLIPYQVSLYDPKDRHERALTHFYRTFPYATEARFITLENASDLL